MTGAHFSASDSQHGRQIAERRSERRFQANQHVRVTSLAETSAAFRAVLANASAHGLRIVTRKALVVGVAVRVDIEDVMVLGEVRYCVRDGEVYGNGIEIRRSPRNLPHAGSSDGGQTKP